MYQGSVTHNCLGNAVLGGPAPLWIELQWKSIPRLKKNFIHRSGMIRATCLISVISGFQQIHSHFLDLQEKQSWVKTVQQLYCHKQVYFSSAQYHLVDGLAGFRCRLVIHLQHLWHVIDIKITSFVDTATGARIEFLWPASFLSNVCYVYIAVDNFS